MHAKLGGLSVLLTRFFHRPAGVLELPVLRWLLHGLLDGVL